MPVVFTHSEIMAQSPAQFFKATIKSVIFVIWGFGSLLFIISLLLFFCLPLYLWRWFVINVCAVAFGPRDLRKAVNAMANVVASEFRFNKDVKSPRMSLVMNSVLEGQVSYQELYDRIDERWIRARQDNGQLKYPELQQHVENWMGFMYFRQDSDFRLERHVKLHELPESGSLKESEIFATDLAEKLLNEIWIQGHSPWEMHLVQNFKRNGNSENLTLIILRFHHVLMDGFATLHMMPEQLFGNKIEVPRSKPESVPVSQTIKHYLTLPWRILRELGHLSWMMSLKSKTPFHIPDSKKSWTQLYCNGPSIPVHKFKQIKNTYGVSFAAVTDSVLAFALGKMLKEKLGENERNNMPNRMAFGVALPRPGHPKKLRNHVSGMVYEVPVDPEMDPIERLLECDRNQKEKRLYPMIMLLTFLFRALSAVPIRIAAYIGTNRFLATGCSSFPGTLGQVFWGKRKFLATYGAAGAGNGLGGVGFFSISYIEHVHFAACAEKAVLSREELEQIFGWVEEQVNILYEMALEYTKEEENNLSNEDKV